MAGFLEHARTAGVLNEDSNLPHLPLNCDFAILELGPGDSLFSAVISSSLKASRVWLVDAGAFATTNIVAYINLFNLLRSKGFNLPFKMEPNAIHELLTACNGYYLTEGIASLAQIPSESIDYCFSNAVLEHIPKKDFNEMALQLFRVLKPEGVCLHRVDLKDHLGGGLNNLRFSETVWESSIFSSSGFYTNRIRFNEMLNIFSEAGFSYKLPRILKWNRLPLSRNKLDNSFKHLNDDDLLVSGFDIVLNKSSNFVH